MSNIDRKEKGMGLELDDQTLQMVQAIADSMPGGFFIYYADNDEELIYYNNSMLRIFGCETREEFKELTHNSFKGIVHPDDLDAVENSIKEQIQNSEYDLDYVEYKIIRKDGTVRWVEDYGHFAHTTMYGNIFYVFIEDATERLKKRLMELEEINEELKDAYSREHQYQRAILHNSVSFFEVNLSQDEFLTSASQVVDGRVVDVFEFMGLSPVTKYSAYIEKCAEQVNEGERAAYRQFFDIDRLIRCFHKGELEQDYEVWAADSFGRRRLGRYVVLLGRQEYSGDIIALSVCTDMTDQIERQNLLQIALRQAQSANIARSTFLMNMSHDIRTPLNAIVGYTDLLKGNCDNNKIVDYVDKIKNSSNQLLSIVKESMEVTWVESGKAVLTEMNCNIYDIIREIIGDVELMMDKKDLDFHVKCDDIRHKYIYVDAIRLKEILNQLLDNSAKYTNSGGYICLTVKEEEDAPEGYGQFIFAVEDNGIGIEDDFKENLFQAFTREKSTTMSKVLGTGLGLTVVKTFVDMMEGTIQVESKVGEGSVFTVKILFKLGERNEDENSAKRKILDRSSLIGKRILLVEDNELNAEIAQELLAQFGFIIEGAENGLVALEKVKKSSPGYYNAILMDIQMPVMDGYEATRQIRKLDNSELANIPIVALSANAFSEDQQKSIECGMDAHFPKPIEIENLVDLLCRVLAKVL